MKAILRYPGSKWRISEWIISHFPDHKSYLEPFFGSGAVLFNKPASPIETINDLNGDVINLFKVIRDSPDELARLIYATPHCRDEYENAWEGHPENELEKARQFLIKSLQSFGFRCCKKSGWKMDIIGRERAYAVQHWNDLPEIIMLAASRLKQVQIENKEAISLIQKFNHPGVLIYADPPYLLSTRSGKQYDFEMASEQEHMDLLKVLKNHKGDVVISGYDNPLYNETLLGWDKAKIQSNAEKGLHRVETIWMNFDAELLENRK